MKLYIAGPSPFARKVRVSILELNLSDAVEEIEVMGTPLDSGSIKLSSNPLGKIPSLERPDGPAIYDSRVITRYLDDRAGGKLYPDAPRLWEALTLEATADGIMDAAILMVYEHRCRPADIVSQDWIDAQWSKIDRSLNAVNERWMSHLNGPMDVAQIGIGVALEYLDFRLPDRDWRLTRPALADWQAEFSKRSSMQETKPG